MEKLTEEQIRDEIMSCYKTESLGSLAARLGFQSKTSIRTRLEEMGVTDIVRDKITAFENGVSTPEEAWLLGFTLSDGHISLPDKGYTQRVRWSQHLSEKPILQWISSYLGLRREPCEYDFTPSTGPSKGIEYDSVVLGVADQGLVDRLAALGAVPGKSANEKYPRIPDPVLWGHFLRGFFDGDGCITYGGRSSTYVKFYGGDQFCQDLKEDLKERVGVSYQKVEKKPGCSTVKWGKKKDIKVLFDLMYPQGAQTFPCLKRKLDRFLEWKSRVG